MENRNLFDLIKEESKRRLNTANGRMHKGQALEELLTEVGMGAAFMIGLLPSDKSRLELFQSWAQHVANEAQKQGGEREQLKGLIATTGLTKN